MKHKNIEVTCIFLCSSLGNLLNILRKCPICVSTALSLTKKIWSSRKGARTSDHPLLTGIK